VQADFAARLTQAAPGRWRLEGDLTLTAVAALAAQAPQPGADGRAELDLAGITRASSAGVALLLEWQAALQTCGASGLRLVNVPHAMRRLAELANVDELLELSAAAESETTDATAS
jgi:phospholipid transport system transporter-binding protein